MKNSKALSLMFSLIFVFITGFSQLGCSVAPKRPPEPLQKLSILQGATGPSSTRFVVLRPAKESLNYSVETLTSKIISVPIEKSLPSGNSEFVLDHIILENLPASNSYRLKAISSSGVVQDERQFHLLNPHSKIRIAVASCMDDSYSEVQNQIWDEVMSESPDLLLMIGDNAYVNVVNGKRVENMSEAILLQRNFETRRDLKIFRMKKLIPTFAIWDDNDYGQNNGNTTFLLKEKSQNIFRSYFNQSLDGENFKLGPGVSSKISVSGIDIFLLDNRSFRTPNKTKPQTHFGKAQEDWLFSQLDPKRFTLLVSGDQWFGGYHPFESYQGDHPQSFSEFLLKLRKKSVSKLIFVSGDRHLSEILKVPSSVLGRKTFEVTSSGIHARTYPDAFKLNPSPNQLAGSAGEFNYMLMDFDLNLGSSINVKSIGLHKRLLFEENLNLN